MEPSYVIVSIPAPVVEVRDAFARGDAVRQFTFCLFSVGQLVHVIVFSSGEAFWYL